MDPGILDEYSFEYFTLTEANNGSVRGYASECFFSEGDVQSRMSSLKATAKGTSVTFTVSGNGMNGSGTLTVSDNNLAIICRVGRSEAVPSRCPCPTMGPTTPKPSVRQEATAMP
jgi:hypothetical protein